METLGQENQKTTISELGWLVDKLVYNQFDEAAKEIVEIIMKRLRDED